MAEQRQVGRVSTREMGRETGYPVEQGQHLDIYDSTIDLYIRERNGLLQDKSAVLKKQR